MSSARCRTALTGWNAIMEISWNRSGLPVSSVSDVIQKNFQRSQDSSLFNEVEACFDEQGHEPAIDDVVDAALKPPLRPKKKGQKEEDLKAFPQ